MQAPSFPQGWKVFPLEPNSKVPVAGLTQWYLHATDDPAQIAAWADQYPGCNWALATGASGLCVIDVDGDEGENSFFEFELEHGPLPATREHKTPKGRHLIFAGTMRNSVGKLGPKIDTRGGNGYIVIPPSKINGVDYECISQRDITPRPDHVAELAGRLSDHVEAASGASLDDDQQKMRARRLLRDYVERGHIAIQGAGGDNRTFEVCAEVLNLGLSPDTAQALIEEIWNPACVPPWDSDELRVKIENANRYSQNEAGAWAVSSTTERLDCEALDRLIASSDSGPVEDTSAPAGGRFNWMDEDQFKHLPDPVWLLPEILQERTLAAMYGKPGSYKSFLALMLGARIAREGHSVFYVAGEGISRMAKNDFPAWKLANGETEKLPFFMMEDVPIPDTEDYLTFAKSIKARAQAVQKPVGLIVIDTLTRAMLGLEENSVKEMQTFLTLADQLKKSFNCTVLVVHHTNKEGTMRGTTALEGYVDTILHVVREEGLPLVRMWVPRQKNYETRAKPFCYEGKKFGPGLAFVEIEAKAASQMSGEADIFAPKNIGAVLARLGARGEGHAVSSKVLAMELDPRAETDTDQEYSGRIGRLVKGLNAAAKDRAEAYAYGGGKALVWYLPEKTD